MSSEKATIHDRLRIERERLGLSQSAVYSRLPVTKGTYIKYESGETSPSARHLAVLDELGFDIYFIVVGERSANELGAEYSNLISAYAKCSEDLRGAALAVLMSHRLKQVQAAKVVPGYFDDDPPFGYGSELPPVRAMHEPGAGFVDPKSAQLEISGGTIGQVVQGDAGGGGKVVVRPDSGSSKKRP